MQPFAKTRACLDYLWSLLRHKYFVFQAGRGFASTWRLLKHDASKFLPSEFFPYAFYFHGAKYGIERDKPSFSKAWGLHKQRNDHHWEYWAEFDEVGGFTIPSIPDAQMREMAADWMGASRAYTGKYPEWFSEWTWYQDEGLKVMNALPEDQAAKLMGMLAARMETLND